MSVLLKRLNSAAFREADTPTRFLTGLFNSPEEFHFNGEEVQIDAVRGKEEYAIDILPYSGGRANSANVFTRKIYKPPAYDEYTYLTAEELNKVQAGDTRFDNVQNSQGYVEAAANLLTDKQILLRNKIIRAIELLSRDALVYGKITLLNGDVIDFKQKAALQYSTPTAWTVSTADPFQDFATLGDRIRQYGVRELKDAIFGTVAIQKFLNNANVKGAAELRQIERIAMTSPMAREEGAKYHGTFSSAGYEVNAWSYPQVVGIPTGYGLPNEGTKVPYIPVDKIICLPENPDFRLYYAGNPTLTSRVSPELMALTELSMMPTIERGEMLPYYRLDYEADSVKVGVRSRPLPVPVGIDEFGIITVT